ncbi:short chain enoyl-CoA hydratase [Tamaricihabitans halophyticus]|uniref:Short chain enoyl-CoA hydratase n=1 Tax=Tamaricihabitans halophyticus TaxID=1262583 RepID=A0A4R2R0D0_9PSEU|nr:enoyl-CoA hydratase/isomerase family protein [Tamaricihabitans halophyticus]TCP54999.1 short chain enoyl-CoA hydratase [Tamaricihabitans halophyticus]
MAENLAVVDYRTENATAWVTLNRPDARNALSFDVLDGIADSFTRAADDQSIRAVVLAANGPAFCAGADLKMVLGSLDGAGVTPFLRRAAEVFDQVARHPQPVIAAVQGNVVAGGLELVLACDLVVAAASATFSDGHTRYGLFPAAGGASRLPRRIGVNRAKQLLFTAESWTASRMYEAGLVTQVASAEALTDQVRELAEVIAQRSPLGLVRIKQVVDEGIDTPLADALAVEMAACQEYARSADFAEGLRAFTQRRAPTFSGA